MLTFVIGETGSGKTSFARLIARGRDVISAGGWVRAMAPDVGHSGADGEFLAKLASKELSRDRLAAAKYIGGHIDPGLDFVIEGVRNPIDLLYLASPGDHVIDLGGLGRFGWEKSGLQSVRSLRGWLERLGVTWAEVSRTFADLPEPIAVIGRSRSWPKPEIGKILALEALPGQQVTAFFRANGGGTFHDLPLSSFELRDRGSGYLESRSLDRYLSPDRGKPVVELGPLYGELCSVFSDQKSKIGEGVVLACIHWPEGNKLLHLVGCGQDLALCPPHKILVGSSKGPLPNWSKLTQA